MKGGKTSPWEGGVRAAAFVSGGLVPQAQRGTKIEDKIHVADWYATFAGLAGADPTDHTAAAAGLPPVDSIDMWPLLSGANVTAPRDWVPLLVDASVVGVSAVKIPVNMSAVIVGDWKLVKGPMILQSYTQGPQFPNSSYVPYGRFTDPKQIQICWPKGCLYNVASDPGELHDVAKSEHEIVKQLDAKIEEMRASHFQSKSDLSQNASCGAAITAYGNFYGPWLP